ncbi:MAG TPA: transketolase [Rhodothermales bacterium]
MNEPTLVSSTDTETLDQLCINSIRFLAADAVQKANSGHPGLPMGAAAMAYVLWTRHLKHNPSNAHWADRDRFVLSAGHGSMLLYALLHLTGYDMPMEELKQFRQWGSKTPGHPEHFLTDGVETTTGPLGQGFANGVGMAIAERFLAAKFNRPGYEVVDHYTYAIVSDGDLMEGVTHEAASLAGHLGLGRLIYLYDDNKISIDGSTDLSFTEDVARRFEAYKWHVQRVSDGNDLDAIDAAIREARSVTDRPSIILVRTKIGYGSPNKAGTSAAHGEPLGEEEVRLAKLALGWPEDRQFYVPDDAYEHFRRAVEAGAEFESDWNALVDRYATAHPELAAQFQAWLAGELPDGWEQAIPTFEAGTKLATRASSGKVLGALAPTVGYLIGGSADLTPSNKTDVKGRADFQKDNYGGEYFRFGVREHGMASACNGMAIHGGVRPYCGTFLIFSDYMRPAVRLSALGSVPVVYVFTHDSIGLGEDGPTHQPIEHLMALRSIPNLVVLRPADANETAEAWKAAMLRKRGPVALALTRQNLPTLDRTKFAPASGLRRGAYVLRDSQGTPDLILIGTGSELHIALEAADTLAAEGVAVRVVSMPSWELFEEQSEEYRQSVFPPSVTRRVAVEAGITQGWERYVGLQGRIVGIDRFGASAPYEVLYEKFGFTPAHVVEKARELL